MGSDTPSQLTLVVVGATRSPASDVILCSFPAARLLFLPGFWTLPPAVRVRVAAQPDLRALSSPRPQRPGTPAAPALSGPAGLGAAAAEASDARLMPQPRAPAAPSAPARALLSRRRPALLGRPAEPARPGPPPASRKPPTPRPPGTRSASGSLETRRDTLTPAGPQPRPGPGLA